MVMLVLHMIIHHLKNEPNGCWTPPAQHTVSPLILLSYLPTCRKVLLPCTINFPPKDTINFPQRHHLLPRRHPQFPPWAPSISPIYHHCFPCTILSSHTTWYVLIDIVTFFPVYHLIFQHVTTPSPFHIPWYRPRYHNHNSYYKVPPPDVIGFISRGCSKL